MYFLHLIIKEMHRPGLEHHSFFQHNKRHLLTACCVLGTLTGAGILQQQEDTQSCSQGWLCSHQHKTIRQGDNCQEIITVMECLGGQGRHPGGGDL